MSFWEQPLRDLADDRDVIMVGAVPAAWADHVRHLSAAGARRHLIVATDGPGLVPGPDVDTVVIGDGPATGPMERIRAANRLIAAPPADLVDAVDRFDPARRALVIGTFLNESSTFAGRPVLAHRRTEWVALEDKTTVDALWDRAHVARLPSQVVELALAVEASRSLDRGDGTVWAGDARDGFHGGATLTRWVHSPATQAAAIADLSAHCDRVRIMPFVEGTPCSIHAIVLGDAAAVLRPVEMVTLRHDEGLLYAGCATFWDPAPRVREQMRTAARRVGAVLRDEVGFRGTFTIDGVAADDGFWPTELNPRYGAGINTIARAAGDVPILLLHDLAAAGLDVGADASTLERVLVDAADARRGGGTWLMERSAIPTAARNVAYDDATARWRVAAADEPPDGEMVAGPTFARCAFVADRTPIGPSVSARAAAFWNFANPHLGLGLGPVTPSISGG